MINSCSGMSFLSFRGGGLLRPNNVKEKHSGRLLLPKLLPNEDSCYLITMVIDDNSDCEQMEPVIERLEEDLGTTVRRINVSRRREFMAALEVMGHDECGRFPFYYNRRTGQAICGATTYLNLKKLGTGAVNHLFNDAPENIQTLQAQGYKSRSALVKDRVQKIQKKKEEELKSGKTVVPQKLVKVAQQSVPKQLQGKSAAALRTEARRLERERRRAAVTKK